MRAALGESMRARQRLLQIFQRWKQWGRKAAHRTAGAIGPACRHLADRLAYRPREVVVVGLLAGGLCGGLGVERWRARYPVTAERLEAEPARLASATAAPSTPRPRRTFLRCEAPEERARPGAGVVASMTPVPRLDLNLATPGELARLAGISRGLAARIVAARDAFEHGGPDAATDRPRGRFARFRRGAPSALPVEPEPSSTSAPDPESLDGSSDAPAQ
jgi:hypothetical protein